MGANVPINLRGFLNISSNMQTCKTCSKIIIVCTSRVGHTFVGETAEYASTRAKVLRPYF